MVVAGEGFEANSDAKDGCWGGNGWCVGGVGIARSASACPPAAATVSAAAANATAAVAAAIDIHTYKQHKLQRRIGDARPAYESS